MLNFPNVSFPLELWQEYYYNVITKRAKWADPPEGRMWERKLALLQQLTPRAVDPTAVTRGLVPGGKPAEPPQWKWRETVRALLIFPSF